MLSGLYLAYPGHAAHLWLSLSGAVVCVYFYQRFDVTERLRRFRLPKVDIIYTTIVDVQLSFPSFFVLLTILALVTPNIWIIMVVIGVLGWVGPARFVRAEILSLREQPFVESARATGGSDRLIIFRYLIPNSMAPVLVSATIGIAGAILTEASLSFLGFGVAAAPGELGEHLLGREEIHLRRPLAHLHPGFCDTHRHARLQPLRRGPARRHEPQGELQIASSGMVWIGRR